MPDPAPQNAERPHWPKAAVSAAIFRDGMVLLAERGKQPSAGLWSLPGGHVEAGETVREAALREVGEETGVRASLEGLVDVHDVIGRQTDGSLRAHYVLTIFFGHWLGGEPQAASDCRTARFVPLDALREYPLTVNAEHFIRRAHALAHTGIR
ncbi:MAG: NUDIX hydrolase [Hyphomicrobiaceae bacterium]|nr:NUDIX hydrolase [Hyphomicrobiaceae bacterium]